MLPLRALPFLPFLLFAAFACEKEPPTGPGLRTVNDVPYYYFTETDKPWLGLQQNEVWQFENARGYRQVYKVSVSDLIQAEDWAYSPPGPSFASPKLLSYFDQQTVYLNRTDSLRGGGTFRFFRDAALLTNLSSGGKDKNKSRFYAKGEWYTFVGNTDLISDYYSCHGLRFPDGAALNGPFQQRTIRGRQYNEIVVMTGTYRGKDCAPTPPSFLQEILYDRQAGIVRMESKAGEVWERVP